VTAAAISPATGRAYGVTRVCRVFAMPRWSFYGGRGQSAGPAVETPVRRRRGPQPAVSDVALLSAIRADLARSAWHGEGHHKVWARLGVLDGIRLARKRVLRLMGETALLSPHRTRPSRSDRHGGRITIEAPTLTRATDAIQIFTVQDGKVWLFGVGEQWNAEAVGWNITKRGDRYAAAAVGMAVKIIFGPIDASAARGVALRHDHGSAFMAEHFQKQIRFRGMSQSYAFVGEPEPDGVAERFFRTLKEQIVHGRIYQTPSTGLRAAARNFVARYSAAWLIKKNSSQSPGNARAAWNQALMKQTA
jgi:putative transposase